MSDTLPPDAAAPGPAEPFKPVGTTLTILKRPDDVPQNVQSFVAHLNKRVKAAKQHFEPDFKRMRADMNFFRCADSDTQISIRM